MTIQFWRMDSQKKTSTKEVILFQTGRSNGHVHNSCRNQCKMLNHSKATNGFHNIKSIFVLIVNHVSIITVEYNFVSGLPIDGSRIYAQSNPKEHTQKANTTHIIHLKTSKSSKLVCCSFTHHA